MREMITRCDNSKCSKIIYKGDSYYHIRLGDLDFDLCPNCVDLHIGTWELQASETVLADNGVEKDETDCVLQALGYTLLNTELYEE